MTKVAVVTGAGSGIGLAVTRLFGANGYVVCGVDLEPTQQCLAVAEATRGKIFQADVSSFSMAREIVQEIVKTHGRIDALVTCAGISRDAGIARMLEHDWDAVVNVDLKGTFNYISAVAPVMRAQNYGKIVTIASTVALRARRCIPNYVAAKAGVIGLTKAAARDLGRHNVNVNAVAPGLVETKLAEQIPPETRARLIEETCLGRIATPEDVANVVLFLCSESARHITGEVIRVDGGQLA